MVNEWTNAKLEDVLDYIQPTNHIVSSVEYSDEYKTPVLTAGKSFIIGYTNEENGIFDRLPTIIFDDFTTSIQFVNFKFKVKSSAMKILVPTSSLVDIRYVFYLMKTLRVNTDTHKRFWISIFSQLPVKIASSPEQKVIADQIEELFSDLDNAIENLKKAQEQLRVYRQAVLKSAFDGGLLPQQNKWKYLPFSEACQFNPSKSESKEISDDTEVSFLPMPCVSENGKILKQEIRRYGDVKKGYTYFREKDVLLAKITPCFENGKKAIAHDLINGIGFGSTEFHVLRPKDEVVSKWILLAISQEAFRNQAIMQMTGAVGQKRVPQRVVEEYKIPIPLKEEQNKIVQEVESRFSVCDNLEETIESSLKQAESLRQSILKQAFEGKLTEQWRKEHKDLISGENSAEALLKKIKAEKEALQAKPKAKKEKSG